MESSCSDLGKWDSGREMNVIKKKTKGHDWPARVQSVL